MSIITFNDYREKIRFEIYSGLLDILRRDEKYQVFQGISPFLTPMGKEMIHDSERLVQLVVTDMILHGGESVTRLTSPIVFAFQQDVFESGNDTFRERWDEMLESDPFVVIKTTGKNNIKPFTSDDRLFAFAFITMSALMKSVNDFVSATLSEVDVHESDSQPFPELLKMSYDQLSVEQKVVVQVLCSAHHSGLVLPLVLVSGTISPDEYVKGLISIKLQPYTEYDSLLIDATCMMDYIACSRLMTDTWQQVGAKISDGENESVEFKSTLRWDIRAGKTNQAVERACLKTISAFLNSQGGTLLIGVRDDGSIEGIESDKFVNEDKFLLHLWTLIRTCLGREVCRNVRTHLEKIGEKTVCIVHCIQSSRPVFLRQPGFDEEFYIRVGPSTNAMDISEALKYIADHFPAG
jgi:hypothetical protein